MKRLVEGEYVREVLDRCTGCMKCDAVCPQDAHPYSLILEHWWRRNKSSGVPKWITPFLLGYGEKDLLAELERFLPPDERTAVQSWARTRAEQVIFVGCNARITPYLFLSPIFRNAPPIYGERSACCGEIFYRLGMLEEAKKRAESLRRKFEERGIKRIICFCPSGNNMIQNVHPRTFGTDPGVEVIPMVSWLLEEIRKGKLKPSPLRFKVTVQDNCHSSSLGRGFIEETREFLQELGLEIVEMEYSRLKAKCCGIGAFASRFSPLDVVKATASRVLEIQATGAQAVAAYCNGCYLVLSAAKLLNPALPPVYHFLELLELSLGLKPERRFRRRLRDLIAAFAGLVLPH